MSSALFLVLCTMRLSVALAAPALDEDGCDSTCAHVHSVRKLRVRCHCQSIAPNNLLTGRIFCRAHRLSRTRRLKEQAAFYLCGEFEEHSLLASVLQPLACPSSQYCNLRVALVHNFQQSSETHGS